MSVAEIAAASAATPGAPVTVAAPRRRRRAGVLTWLAAGWLALVVLLAVLAPAIPGLADPNEVTASIARRGPGAAGHVLGGDATGRDMLARLVYGARASIAVGVGAIALGGALGGVLGLVAGYYRGRFETLIVGLFDIMLAFPQLVLALAIVAFLGQNQLNLTIALAVVGTPILGRIARASTLTFAQRDFVTAARAQGARDRQIIWREILPNVLPSMLSIALLGVAVVIVAEGGLAILGIGVKLPTPSWGNIIAEGRGNLVDAPHMVFEGSAVIFLTVLALNYLGDVVVARFDRRGSAL
jgi:peptide/nickel transport system permease protein